MICMHRHYVCTLSMDKEYRSLVRASILFGMDDHRDILYSRGRGGARSALLWRRICSGCAHGSERAAEVARNVEVTSLRASE